MPTIYFDGIGDVTVSEEEMKQYDPDQFRQKLVQEYADYANENDIDMSAFSTQFAKEFTSTARGLSEMMTGERTTTAEQDFLAEVALAKDPVRGWAGLILGAIADPITLPFAFAKLFKLGKIGMGAAAGAFGGATGAVRQEYGEDRLMNTIAGAGLGGVLGAGISVLMRKFNVKTPEELQKIADEGGEEAQRLAKELEKLAEDPEVQAELNATPKADRPEVDQDIEQMKLDYRNEQDIQRQIDEMQAEVDNMPSSAQGEKFYQAIDETNAYIADVLDPKITKLERQYKLATTSKKPMEEKRTILADLQKQIDDLKAEKELRINERDTRDQPLVDRLQELRKAKAELRRYDNGKGPLPSFVKPPEVTKVEVAPVEPTVKINEPAPKVETTAPKTDNQFSGVLNAGGAGNALRNRLWDEYTGKVGAVDPKVKQIREQNPNLDPEQLFDVLDGKPVALRPEQIVQPTQGATVADLQQPKFTGKSVGAGQRNILTLPTSAADAATLDLRTKAARNLGEPPKSVTGARPEMTPRQAKQQEYMRQKDSEMDQNLFNTDDVEGKYTFKNLLDAAEDKQYFVEREIDEGNYKDAADWIAREFENSSGILSPATKIVASRIYAIASDNLVKLQEAFAEIEKTGKVSAKMVEMLGEMQEDAQLRNAMDVMRNIERIEGADKKNTSAALNAFKLANRMKKDQMQKLARASTISHLYFGVEC